jgi:O-acetyl-ADP-ribose deacetylase (regulator of RNase III)
MIKFVGGDFFDYDADIRINTVNCVGVMGAGVALLFKNRFPDMYNDYSRACENNEVAPGKPHIWQDNDMFKKLTIINFPTKIDWKNPSEYEYIEKGLVWLKQFLSEKENLTVTLPALGCGHGGLDWTRVKDMITKYLGNIHSNILVFEPSSSTKTSDSVEIEKMLLENNISRLLPSDNLYPNKLIGRSAIEIFYKGNIEMIKRKNIAIVVNSQPEEREKKAILTYIEELPNNEFPFLLGFSNKYEIDLVKEILLKGFKAIIVIPYGIMQLKIRKDLQDLWNYNNITLLSITSLDQTWKNYESVNALKFRLKLANITLINSLNFEKFLNFEKDFKLPNSKIFYLNYWNNQIDFFDRLSARKVGLNPKTLKPNIFPVLDTLNRV